jgi:hypothetical protein
MIKYFNLKAQKKFIFYIKKLNAQVLRGCLTLPIFLKLIVCNKYIFKEKMTLT